MQHSSSNLDKAGVEYWDQTERNSDRRSQMFGPLPGIRGFGRRLWHARFVQDLKPLSTGGAELLELGCGGSTYLPYFARELGFTVSGIDYSQGGIEIERELCAAHGVSPELFCVDIFDAPAVCRDRYDTVASFGVLEHFTDTEATLRAFASFLRPGGKLLTVVPNMQGLCGLGQRLIAPDVYAVHEVIDLERMRTAHERAGLQVEHCEYFMFSNFGVINPGASPGTPRRLLFSALRATTALSWGVESVVGCLPANRWTSPYVVCLASKAVTAPASH